MRHSLKNKLMSPAAKHADILGGTFTEVEEQVKEAALHGWMQLVDATFPAPPQQVALALAGQSLWAGWRTAQSTRNRQFGLGSGDWVGETMK
jgi:hypothetical protein